jgi:acyl-CoA thioester hydrolase
MRHQVALQVRWGDMDAYQHVNNVAYAAYLQEARAQLFAAELAGTAAQPLLGTLVLARLKISYLRPLVHTGAWITAQTWFSALTAATVTVECSLDDIEANPDGPYCHGTTVLAPFDFTARRPTRITPEQRAALSAFLESSPPAG